MQQTPLASAVPRSPQADPPTVGFLAHELNNVLATVAGYASFVHDGLAEDIQTPANVKQMREDAQMVLDAARRGAEITAQLMKLDLARATAVEASR